MTKLVSPDDKAVLLVDSTCTLCNQSVEWIVKHGGEDDFRFISLYSEEGKEYLKDSGLPEDYDQSVVLISGDRTYIKSDALLKIVLKLDGLLPLLSGFKIIPRKVRDGLYGLIARHRHRF